MTLKNVIADHIDQSYAVILCGSPNPPWFTKRLTFGGLEKKNDCNFETASFPQRWEERKGSFVYSIWWFDVSFIGHWMSRRLNSSTDSSSLYNNSWWTTDSHIINMPLDITRILSCGRCCSLIYYYARVFYLLTERACPVVGTWI